MAKPKKEEAVVVEGSNDTVVVNNPVDKGTTVNDLVADKLPSLDDEGQS